MEIQRNESEGGVDLERTNTERDRVSADLKLDNTITEENKYEVFMDSNLCKKFG